MNADDYEDSPTTTALRKCEVERYSRPRVMEAAQQPHHLIKRVIDSKASQECVRAVKSPKPNQVGTVLLYGVPIVSLYIESQERLCLAQISNTLLKQFSYNEIHNRRVALGITCVQCTPVQLEILRRAGAMPVSSRRCGMITRREAERLCKSFLGDNAPPRLPEDFAFSVHHECAWGCRGSFLPSRYNSSRAKCIKCSYCGLFFSPNKFIFHSHRIGPGDKYVQPDAANFNSWRRHMKLSGNPPEEIVHAWEDVKAMFNGGTRKRLMSNSPNTSQHVSSPKRIKETQISPPLIHAAAAAAVVSAAATANVAQFPIRPVNIHHPTSPTTTNTASRIPGLGGDLPLPFSRSFMMDYMWHAQNKSNTLQFPGYTLPWMKRPASLLLTQQQTGDSSPGAEDSSATTTTTTATTTPNSPATNPANYSNITSAAAATTNSAFNDSPLLVTTGELDTKSLPFYNNSAFKPVINQNRTAGTFSSAATALIIGATHHINDDRHTPSRNSAPEEASTIKESLSSDDEMVDIETTEEEQIDGIGEIKFRSDVIVETSSSTIPTTTPNPGGGICIKVPESPPIEVENSSDGMGWDGVMKKELQNSVRSSFGSIIRSPTPVTSMLSHSSSSPVTSEHHQSGSATLAPVPVDISTATPTVQLARGANVEQLTSTPSAAAAAAAVAIAAFGQSAAAAVVVAGSGGTGGGGGGPGGGSCIPPSLSPPILTSHATRTLNGSNSSSNNNNNNFLGTAPTPNELWSVARFSFDRPDYRIPFYRHDITKHFQTFRHGEQTTQANGI